MPDVGELERRTQRRIVNLFRTDLEYDYLGDWTDRDGNRNVEEDYLAGFVRQRWGCSEDLVARTLYALEKAASDTRRSLYDRNRDVYDLLRYGVRVREDAGEHTETVWLIDWKNPGKNHFAIAEEVTVAAASDRAHPTRPDVVLYENGIALAVLGHG